jgi:hypothetical protein
MEPAPGGMIRALFIMQLIQRRQAPLNSPSDKLLVPLGMDHDVPRVQRNPNHAPPRKPPSCVH